jgi:hypothetical protein
MKKTLYGIVLFAVIILTACSQTRYVQDDYGNDYTNELSNGVTYQQFYDNLSPYGEWISNPDFGYVWAPGISGFRPYYTNGHWSYTNYGWTWVSNYNWGWAPFHYGRWFYDDFYGWLWAPGYEWAPAWVNWRGNSQYYGWAPMCPAGRNGRYYQIRNDQWSFIPQQYITNTNINNYYINSENNSTIINNTREINKVRVINNRTKYEQGPSVAEVERVTKTRITPITVRQSSTPGEAKIQDGTLRIFKPTIKQQTVSGSSKPTQVIQSNTSTQPSNSVQTNNGNIASPKGRIIRRSTDENVTPNSTGKTAPVINNQPSVNNNPETESTRQFSREQIQRENNMPKVRQLNNNNDRPQPVQQENSNSQRRVERSLQKTNRIERQEERTVNRERVINTQQRNSPVIQRQRTENAAPVFTRPQPTPGSSQQIQEKFSRPRIVR